ncbi:MAG: hypothetical protein K2O70_03370, partial [Desulfovibrionaceae bacterium]|nr:hypothetical protein [Desulfovibrionaceae bacterium]
HDHSLSGTVGATTLSVAQVGSHNHTAGGSVSSSGSGGTFESTEKAAVNTLYTHASGGSQPHTHSLSADTGTANNMPPYYALAFIMRL